MIQKLARMYNIRPTRSKGQNFLHNFEVLQKIVDAAELTEDDTVLEVGPGFGIMTELLARKAKKVIGVELDKKFVDILKAQLAKYNNIEIIQGDILELPVTRYQLPAYKIVANIPYYITSQFLRKFLTLPFPHHSSPLSQGEREEVYKPQLMVLLLQKEVAQRICARAGEMSMLSFSVQFFANPKIVEHVGKENFWPEPEVDSSIIIITPLEQESIRERLQRARTDEKGLFRLVKFGFSSRRKQLHNNLSAALSSLWKKNIPSEKIKILLESIGLERRARAQELSVDNWIDLAQRIHDIF